MNKMSIKENHKEFLYLDEQVLNHKIELYKLNVGQLNSLIKEAENVLKKPLTDAEKKKISTTGAGFIIASIEKKFPFAGASEDFNLNALGINWGELKRLNKTFAPCEYEIKLEDGIFTTTGKGYEILKNQSKVYTTSKKQNEALEIGKDFLSLLDRAKDAGIFYEQNATASVFPFMINLRGEVQLSKRKVSVL